MRCSKCNKKTIMEYECKCLKKFCLNCLPYFIHDCLFDYKKTHKDLLKETNPQILAEKVVIL